jgi:ethanolamine ammonia-lyase large subunit
MQIGVDSGAAWGWRGVAPLAGEDVFGYLERVHGGLDERAYRAIVGAASEFKEGDATLGVAALDEEARAGARRLLAATKVGALQARPLRQDRLYAALLNGLDQAAAGRVAGWTLAALKDFVLGAEEAEVKAILPGLASDVIACLVKLMSDAELVALGARLFHPLPGRELGGRGRLAARLQPNSPTDHPEDIRWQVFDGWAYGVGDLLLGTNPASSDPAAVAAVEATLLDLRETFGVAGLLPHCVLAHIDVQAALEAAAPGSTGIWFQSLAGSDDANATFGISLESMLRHAAQRGGEYGMYFETGQGSELTNGHGDGVDMVVHEARKYGFVRLLRAAVAAAQVAAGRAAAPWVHVNDVAGFIGPEVFRSREQLLRCCLEDIAMGKLHGLMIGLDVCATLHMEVDLDDLEWVQDRVVAACPGYLMALPTRNDPMLGYLTTSFQDHVRLRARGGLRVDDEVARFFCERLGVLDGEGRPGPNFGEPLQVFLRYRRARGDVREVAEILAEGRAEMAAVRARGVALAEGHGAAPWDLAPALEAELRANYVDARACLRAAWRPEFLATLPDALQLRTRAEGRDDYILHPARGERLADESAAAVEELRRGGGGGFDVQIVASDGLSPLAMMDPGHLLPYLEALRAGLAAAGYRVAPTLLVVTGGRVRVGYEIGARLLGDPEDRSTPRAIVHAIGERPGTVHHNFSAYITAAAPVVWAAPGAIDHPLTRVLSGISDTACAPALAAAETVKLLRELAPR